MDVRKSFRIAICLLGITSLGALAGCGADHGLEASDVAFSGLDSAVVAEVLANPAATMKISQEPEDTRGSLAQGIVRNFIVCRDFYDTYEVWRRTGQAPAAPVLPQPSNPLEPSASGWPSEFRNYSDALRSGDITRLKSLLTGDSGCGVWVPAKAGDVSGPTIAVVVRGGS